MLVELHNRLASHQAIEATSVIIRNRFGEPIVVVQEHAPGQYWVKSAAHDADFAMSLEHMGIDGAPYVDRLTGDAPGNSRSLLLPSGFRGG